MVIFWSYDTQPLVHQSVWEIGQDPGHLRWLNWWNFVNRVKKRLCFHCAFLNEEFNVSAWKIVSGMGSNFKVWRIKTCLNPQITWFLVEHRIRQEGDIEMCPILWSGSVVLLLLLRVSSLGHLPWILKRGRLESSGQRLISLNS